ncbi:hypothetical protein MAHJHV55_27680 [Mycobacterium avium subsp. hominissuis]
MNAIPADGVGRLLFFVEDRLAQLRWTREDLAAAGGPAPSTLYKAAERGGGLSVKTLARMDVALGWQEGSAQQVLAGGNPAVRISEQVSSCAAAIDAARRDAECAAVSRCATELKNFLLDVAQRLDDFYTEPVRAVGGAADVSAC